MVVDGDVKVRSLLMWLFFTQICLFEVMCTMSFYFLIVLVVLLCFIGHICGGVAMFA
jgi:hypothetical protein